MYRISAAYVNHYSKCYTKQYNKDLDMFNMFTGYVNHNCYSCCYCCFNSYNLVIML